jgi:hypothetical protein
MHQGLVLAILAMLTPPGAYGTNREGLRVAPGGSDPPLTGPATPWLCGGIGTKGGWCGSIPPGDRTKGYGSKVFVT